MKIVAAAVASLVVIGCPAQAQEANAMHNFKTMLSCEDVRSVAPALDKYTQDRLLGDVWKRPGLNSRDRSIVTLAALIGPEQTIEVPYHFNLALDDGVKPAEISGILD